MGPVMPASKKPESSGISVSSGLSHGFSKALQEVDDLTFLCLTRRAELAACLQELAEELWGVGPQPRPSPAHSDTPCDARQDPNCKPPYSFSCLIFLATEDSPTKRLPVKDIYNWILEHFPYFANAPTGWRNSVRHNLSLNKLDKERSQRIGKGSLWCLDPEYRQNLIQAYQSPSGPPIWPGSTFFKRNGIQAVSPGVIQNGRGLFPGIRPLPITPIGMMAAMRNGITSCRMRTESEPSCGSPVVSGDPKEDHNYSSAKSSNAQRTSPTSDSVSSASPPADHHYEFATKGRSKGSFQSHESHSETEEDDRKPSQKEAKDHKKRQHFTKARKVPSDTLPLKKRRTEKPPESNDEEMKEAAGSLLHLAGVRSCLNNITNRTAKGQKEQKETTKN
ncbi:FOXN3-containing [Ictidomys tridecemlineatus]|uniref:Forkhead box protein N3 pseudogene n=1 Tax=Ictidomys tridecemlineatus TaxID=43179 RepID=A0A287D521_ICTTR|nr:FOXN3-containing [Ictidomys tridecemlineatus]